MSTVGVVVLVTCAVVPMSVLAVVGWRAGRRVRGAIREARDAFETIEPALEDLRRASEVSGRELERIDQSISRLSRPRR